MIARSIALGLLLSACGTLSAGTLPAKETDQVADRLSPAQPGQLHLTGWLGNRIDANRSHWLLTADLDKRLRPFATHNEREGWSGEHIGKWLHAAAITWAYGMMSNLVGLCELYRATGDRRLLDACAFAHDDIVQNQMYLTGGVSFGEYFQDPHHLPNTGAVSENCAQVTWMQLAIQLLRLTGSSYAVWLPSADRLKKAGGK